MRKSIVLIFLFFMFVFLGNVFADTLYLKNGSQFTGRTIRQDAEKVLFRIGSEEDGVDLTFFSEQILRIDKAQVSSFITVPFGQGKQIDIPRPAFSKEPILTEQARSQQEKKQKAAEEKQAKIKAEEASLTNTTQEAVGQLEGLPKPAGGNLFAKRVMLNEELTPLLDKEEKIYFSKINSMVQLPMESMMFVLNNPGALTQDKDKLQQIINAMPSQIEGIITQLNNLKPPSIFVDFHKKYADNLNLIKDVFLDMSKGDTLNLQEKLDKLQNLNSQLQEELNRILNEKKNKTL